jgi:hypothetical protein
VWTGSSVMTLRHEPYPASALQHNAPSNSQVRIDMKKTVLGSAVAVAWCVAMPMAYQQAAPTSTPTPAHNVFVTTGCLTAGAEAADTFKLTDASPIDRPSARGAAEAVVGTAGQKPSYELRPVSGVDAQGLDADALKAHLGRRIEVVVRPIESPAPAPSAGVTGNQSAKPIEPAPERYSVTEVRRVIGTCS